MFIGSYMIKSKFHGFMPRVFWSVVGLMFIFSLFFTLVVIFQQGKLLKEELVRKGLSSAGNLASSSRLGIFAESSELIQPGIDILLQEKSVLYAGAYNLEGKALIVKKKTTAVPLLLEEEKERFSDEFKVSINGNMGPFHFEKDFGEEKIFEFWAPVVVSRAFDDEDILMDDDSGFGEADDMAGLDREISKTMGLVRVGFSLKEIETSLNNIVWMSISIVVLFIPIGFLFAYLLAKRITKPILLLNRGVDAIEKGETFEKIHIHSKDEIGHLASSFNSMVESLRIKDDEIMQRVEQLSALNMVASAVNQSLDLKRTLHDALKEIMHLTKMECSWIYLPSEKNDVYYVAAHEGISEENVEEVDHLKPGEGITGKVVVSGKPIFVEDLSVDDRATRRPSLLKRGFRAFASIPLRSKDQTLGAMNITSHTIHEFSKDEIELLHSIGDQVGTAIENAQLYESLKKHLEEIERTQDQLIRATKLASIGELAANVAHEVNNPLTGVLTHACLMIKDESLTGKNVRRAEIIRDETLRIRTIVKNLLNLARESEYKKEKADITDIIADIVELVSHRAKIANVKILEEYDDHLPMANIDKTQIKQVFLNLFNNALDAMPEGGALKIEASSSKHWLNISVHDTGMGIPDNISEKIFDPFFTTKPEMKGTGLGLSITHGIIERHGGSIELESEEGKGSNFIIQLPLEE